MQIKVPFNRVDFGEPEAEHDAGAIEHSFYESEGWKKLISKSRLPFVIGRKGAGKSAIVTKLELLGNFDKKTSFLRIVPANFRHVEIRALLSSLVSKEASWQYIYGKVWEGILLGQLVHHIQYLSNGIYQLNLSKEIEEEINKFSTECAFYCASISESLSDVITNYVKGASKKTDDISLVELRKMLEPYQWNGLIQAIRSEFRSNTNFPDVIYIAIDGLDEHWDCSEPSLFFLAQLLERAKHFTAEFFPKIKFIICLRDNIFRSLVDTKSIEYDKIESLVLNLEWNSRSLFELISRRVLPNGSFGQSLSALRSILPESIDEISIDDYIGHHILSRPRDYINFFKMLQNECGDSPHASSWHVKDTVARYKANRLIDLDNEFGLTYPGVSKLASRVSALSPLFHKNELLKFLADLTKDRTARVELNELLLHYGDPETLARILISIGVIGYYEDKDHALRFIHEFSEGRVASIWDAHDSFGVHPVYRVRTSASTPKAGLVDYQKTAPAIITNPVDYLPTKDNPEDLELISEKRSRKNGELIAEISSIDKGQAHFRRWEKWVGNTLQLVCSSDWINMGEQITNHAGDKRFEIVFDIAGRGAPWDEIKGTYNTHRALVECKNTEEPTQEDFLKLERDMKALSLSVAFMAYRGDKREPQGKFLERQRSAFVSNDRKIIIVALSEKFLIQCLEKGSVEKCRKQFNTLWRDHMTRWLVH